ncbi:MAG: RluA family pseudouridine synthase [Chloroflexi bacterium]|nr:MAG: RluA family pseudouridine synthase [Chloroflexota bacterium]
MHNPERVPAYVWTIQAEQIGLRLDRFLVSALEQLSRTGVQQLIADGQVLVNGRLTKASYALRAGDSIEMLQALPVAQQQQVKPQALPLDICYEDDDLFVINKAAGMVVHPAPGHADDTLVNALVAYYPALQQMEEGQRPGIVHRLDRDTSGLLVVARNTGTQAALVEQMKRHEVVKRYLALVEGIVELEKGSIDAPIGRDPRHRQQMTITVTDSRQARTHFWVLKRFHRHTLLRLQLETGRTHQIRVHLQAIGHPVVGDPIYGAKAVRKRMALQRQFLHAQQLEFVHPTSGVKMSFEAPLPPDLQAILEDEAAL